MILQICMDHFHKLQELIFSLFLYFLFLFGHSLLFLYSLGSWVSFFRSRGPIFWSRAQKPVEMKPQKTNKKQQPFLFQARDQEERTEAYEVRS